MQKTLALVAHDHKKPELIRWSLEHKAELEKHNLVATGTTGGLLQESLNLPVTRYKSGPLGGDQQIGALIAEGKLDALISRTLLIAPVKVVLKIIMSQKPLYTMQLISEK